MAVWFGAWRARSRYPAGAMVTNTDARGRTQTYISTATTLANEPPDADYWRLLEDEAEGLDLDELTDRADWQAITLARVVTALAFLGLDVEAFDPSPIPGG